MGGVRWTERLAGYLSFDQTDFNQAFMEGKRDGAKLELQFTLQIDDIEEFVKAQNKRAQVTSGLLESPDLRGRLDVHWGEFELLAQADEFFDHLHLRMRYRLNLLDAGGRELRLAGFKQVEDDPGYDAWADTTTLFARIYKGWWTTRDANAVDTRPHPWVQEDEAAEKRAREQLLATAVLQISRASFLRELTTFRGTAGSPASQLRDVLRFGGCFAGGIAKAYVGPTISDGRPSFPRDYPRQPWRRTRNPNAWHPVPGREQDEREQDNREPGNREQDNGKQERANRYALEREIIPFEVEDLAFPLNLHHIKGANSTTSGDRGPVLLAHGAGVRAEMFYGQPLRETVVDHLLQEGYDVWALNWRGSIDFPNNSYTLDQVARFDHPNAVKTVLEKTETSKLRALVHCQGSVSFLMAAVAGFLPTDPDTHEDAVSHVVSSGISLFFDVPNKTLAKQRVTLPLVTRLATGADPQSGILPINAAAAMLARISKHTERPCGNVPCQVANFIYGAGWDVLLCHANVDDEVHQWTARELGYTPFSLISQVAESSRYGHIVPAHAGAPPSYVAGKPRINGARFTFLGCEQDTMFEARGQQRAAEFLQAYGVPADYVPLARYGHMDAYWGKDAARDVFPAIVSGLQWSEDGRRPSEEPRVPLQQGDRDPELACAPGFCERWRVRCEGRSRFSEPPPPRSRTGR